MTNDLVVSLRRRRAAAPLIALVALVLAGMTFAGPATAAMPPLAASYRNPVHDVDFADPFVVATPAGWVAYATQHGLANIQIATSPDLVTWTDAGTALPFLPPWADGFAVWAPSVLVRSDHAVLYYAVSERSSGRVCVSAAVAPATTGPFIDHSTGPLVCQRELSGTIDPSPFVDGDGRVYLLFKSEGIAGAEPTRLWAQPLRADGLALEGAAVELLHTEEAWENPIVEGPSMTRDPDGRYHLLYSGGRWQSADYAVGWATCDSPLGPCRRGSTTPVLQRSADVAGPGGAEFFSGPADQTWIAFHAWVGAVGYPQGRRSLLIERVGFAGGQIFLEQPSTAVMRFDHDPVPRPPPGITTSPMSPPDVAASGPDVLPPEVSAVTAGAPRPPVAVPTPATPDRSPVAPAQATATRPLVRAPVPPPPGTVLVRSHQPDATTASFAAVTAIVTAAAACTAARGRRRRPAGASALPVVNLPDGTVGGSSVTTAIRVHRFRRIRRR